jgi:MFS family permease
MISDYKPLLANARFRYIWASQILSQLTINITNFLLLTRLFEETGSTIATSFLWVVYALPAIFIGPLAAASVDMISKRKMLMVTNLLQALVIFAYAFLHQASLFLLYGVALAYSFFNQFYVPAEASTIPAVVPKPQLAYANSLFFLTQQSSVILGFGFAGILRQLLGFETTLFVCAFFLFLAFVSVAFLPQMKPEEVIPKKFEEAIVRFFERIMEGYVFIRDHKRVLAPFVLLLAIQIAVTITAVNVPIIAKDIFNIPLNSAGYLIMVPSGIGAILGALLSSNLLKRGWRKKRTIETFLTLTSFCGFILVFVVPQLGQNLRVLAGILTIVIAAMSMVGTIIPAQTYLQEATPGGLRGRVFGNYWFMATIATVFPVILSGTVAELFGIRLLLFILSGLVLAGLIFSKKKGQDLIDNELQYEKI